MTSNTPPNTKSGLLGGRRLVLLGTTILSLGAAALIVAPDATRHGAFAQNVTQQAQTVARPTGFADVVETVKPAVISVRVKVDRGPQLSSDDDNPFPPGSPFERFFRRFGGSDARTARPRPAQSARPQLLDRPGLRLLHLG